jgi:aspartate racemase
MVAAGAEALAMPCNTAHHYASAIRAVSTVPFLDMIDLSAARAAARVGPGGTVGILASPAVQLTGLFDAALARHGALSIYPVDQSALLGAIREIKQQGPTENAKRVLSDAAGRLAIANAGVQLVACSEFSLLAQFLDADFAILDTLDVLVDEIVRFAQGGAGALRGVADTTRAENITAQ